MRRGRVAPAQGPLVLLSAVAVAIAVLLLLLVIFQAIDTFSSSGKGDKVVINQTVVNGTGTGCIEQIITSNTSELIQVIVIDNDEICDPFVITTWRLHRVCNTVHFGFQGFCQNAKESEEDLDLDLSMVNFPIAVGTPSPHLERYDVSGVGSVVVNREGIAGILEVDGDERNQRFIDVDVRLNGDFEEGDDIEIALLCMYEVFDAEV
jgi:hypothetical protein